MRPYQVAIILAICLFGLSPTVHAQEQSTPITATGVTASPQEVVSDSPEVIALRAQLEIVREYQEHILTTAQWTMSIALTIVVVIVSVGWIVNFQIYKRDLAVIREELLLEARKEGERIQTALNDRITQQMAQIEQNLENTVELTVSDLMRRVNTVVKAVKADRMDRLEKEAERWRELGYAESNVFTQYARALRVAADGEFDYRIPELLRVMQESLRDGADPPPDTVSDLTAVLDTLPSKYSIEVQKLRQLLLSPKS